MQSQWPKQRRGQRDMSRAVHEWRFEVGSPDHGFRLDAFLSSRIRWRSRQGVREAIETERVEVLPFKDPLRTGVGRVRPSLRLRAGQEVIVRLPAPQAESPGQTGEPSRAQVVFEDERLVALDKPPHRNVYPSRRHRADSLIEWVHARHRRLHGPDGYFPAPCHRLDRETSGLVLFAKSRSVRAALSRKFEIRSIRKRYLALVWGRPQGDRGVIDAGLTSDDSSIVEMKVAVGVNGRPARTLWSIVRLLGDVSLLELEPKTGRRHQLRVHLASIGHPIVGDKLYSGGDETFLRSLGGGLTDDDHRRLALGRQALHAWKLDFELDDLGGPLSLEAPLAEDIEHYIEPWDSTVEPRLGRVAGS